MYEIWKQLGEDTRNGVFWMPVLAVSIALVVSSVAWPLVYYHTTQRKLMVESGYEEVADPRDRSATLWVKKGDDK